MRALQLITDRELALSEVEPPPPPAAGEVQLRIRFVGLNHIDVWGLRGMAFAKRLYPLSVGAEASAEVLAVGPDVTNVVPGDRVVPFSALTCGICKACRRGRDNLCENVGGVRGFHVDGFAQDITNHPARLVVKIPDAVSLEDAACVAVAYSTVEHMLFDNAHLEPEETVLVQAGASGIGTIAVKIAKSLGCTVIATAGSADKCRACVALGAAHAINYREEDFVAVIKDKTGGEGVNVILDMVGGDYIQRNISAAAPGGRIVNIAYQKGATAEVNFGPLLRKRLSLLATTLRGRSNGEKGVIRDAVLKTVWPLIGSGRIKPVVDSRFSLAEAQKAHETMRNSGHIGKILLVS